MYCPHFRSLFSFLDSLVKKGLQVERQRLALPSASDPSSKDAGGEKKASKKQVAGAKKSLSGPGAFRPGGMPLIYNSHWPDLVIGHTENWAPTDAAEIILRGSGQLTGEGEAGALWIDTPGSFDDADHHGRDKLIASDLLVKCWVAGHSAPLDVGPRRLPPGIQVQGLLRFSRAVKIPEVFGQWKDRNVLLPIAEISRHFTERGANSRWRNLGQVQDDLVRHQGTSEMGIAHFRRVAGDMAAGNHINCAVDLDQRRRRIRG